MYEPRDFNELIRNEFHGNLCKRIPRPELAMLLLCNIPA